MTFATFLIGLCVGLAFAKLADWLSEMAMDALRERLSRPPREMVHAFLAGKWLAWSPDGLWILAYGDDLEAIRKQMEERGIEAIYERAPRLGFLPAISMWGREGSEPSPEPTNPGAEPCNQTSAESSAATPETTSTWGSPEG